MESSPGRTSDTYTVRELLGAGAVGEVWRATDDRLNRDVAIKLLRPHLSSDPQRARRFAEEARTAGSLNHPNILSVYDVGEHGGVPFIVSEYVDGESLRMRLKRGPLSIDVAAAVALQMARGLSAAHARGIIHCDLKPDNVFIRADGGVKILDFGLARLKTAPATLSDLPDVTVSSLAGTAGYIAPEQVLGQEADVRSDLFALGVTMFEMLSGARPFKGDSVVETLNATLMLEPADLRAARADVPAPLSRIVMRLLEKAPDSRFQSAEELVQAFEEATTAATTSAQQSWAALPILMAAAVVTTLIVTAALMLRTAPAVGTVAPGPSGRPGIAVMNFVNTTGTEDTAWLSTGIQSMLLTGLAQIPGLDIVSQQRVHEALKLAGHTDLASLDRSEAADVARRAGAGAVVAGTIYQSRGEIRIDAQIEDLASGRVLAAHSVTGTDVFALADSLATRIRTGIGLGDAVELRRITDVSSTSIAAYRLYVKGLDASVNVRWPEAVTWLEQAIAIDPTFAEAHLRLASAYEGLGQIAVSGVFPNLEKLLTITRTRATVLPASPQARNMYGYALTEAGRLAEAIGEFEQYARLAPREPNPFDSLGGVYLSLGAPAEAVQSYSRALAIDPGFPSGSGSRTHSACWVGTRRRLPPSRRSCMCTRSWCLARAAMRRRSASCGADWRVRRSTAICSSRPASILRRQYCHSSEGITRRCSARSLRADPLSAVPPGFARHWSLIADTLAGLADLGLGRTDRAEALAVTQARLFRPSHPVERLWHWFLQGELALVRGDPAGAAMAFSAGELPRRGISLDIPGAVVTNNLILRDGATRAAHARGDLPAAIEIYRRLLANGPDQKWVALYEPRYVLQLARLLEQAGDRQAARGKYLRFLELWKHADATLPELAQARRALAVK
jgi:tetratricopeptide (TPR) repeat protein